MSKQGSLEVMFAGNVGPELAIFSEIASRPGFPFVLSAITGPQKRKEMRQQLMDSPLKNLLDGGIPVLSLKQAVDFPADIVFSALPDDEAQSHEHQLAEGRLLITTAAANRQEPDVALASPYINPIVIDDLFDPDRPDARILAVGNTTAVILSLSLAPLVNKGLEKVHVETLQGWSGLGKTKVPRGKQGEIVSITSNEKHEVKTETPQFLDSATRPAALAVSAELNQGPWVEGYHQKVTARLSEATSRAEVDELWRAFKAPEVLRGVRYGKAYSPRRRPIDPTTSELLHFDPLGLARTRPMRLRTRLRELSEDNHEITFDVAANNLKIGGTACAAMTMVYVRQMNHLGTK